MTMRVDLDRLRRALEEQNVDEARAQMRDYETVASVIGDDATQRLGWRERERLASTIRAQQEGETP